MTKKIAFAFLAVLLLLACYGVYYYIVVGRNDQIKQTTTSPVKQAVNGYFNEFMACMKNPPAAAKGKASEYCQTNNRYAGSRLAANLDKQAKRGFVPVICAQNPPQSVAPIGVIMVTGNVTTAMLDEQFASGQVSVAYELDKENDQWKVENISCPAL